MRKNSAHTKVGKILKSCKISSTTYAGLTHTTDSKSTLDRCQQAGTNFFGGQYIIIGSLLQTLQDHRLLLICLTAQLRFILVVSKHIFVPRYYIVYERSPRRQASWNQLGVFLGGSLTWLIGREGVGPNCMENEENFGLEWCWMALWIER
jgi:hypothetical protein